MPPTIPNQDAWLVAQLAQLKRDVAALKAQQTQYVIDASGTTQAIIGNLAAGPSGTATGLSGFGITSFQAKNNGWTAPTLINSWANIGGAAAPAGYLKDALGFVHFRGVVHSGTSGTVAFVLPVGFRPGFQDQYPVLEGGPNGPAGLVIDASGNVSVFYTSAPANVGLVIPPFLAEN